jgi:hypothetical protein
MVRLLPEEERIRRSRAIQAMHSEWTTEQLAAGVDGPTPDSEPAKSDYNQHVPDLEADADAEDEFWHGMDQISQESSPEVSHGSVAS